MEKEFYILIKGEKVPVSEEEYRAFKRPVWAAKKRRQREQESGTAPLSLDALVEAGFDVPSDQALVDEIVADKLLLDMLLTALDELTEDERSLIDALFYQEKSEREVARELDRSKTSVHKQKENILSKLRNLLK